MWEAPRSHPTRAVPRGVTGAEGRPGPLPWLCRSPAGPWPVSAPSGRSGAVAALLLPLLLSPELRRAQTAVAALLPTPTSRGDNGGSKGRCCSPLPAQSGAARSTSVMSSLPTQTGLATGSSFLSLVFTLETTAKQPSPGSYASSLRRKF